MIGARRLRSALRSAVPQVRAYHHGFVRKAQQSPWQRAKAYTAAAVLLGGGLYVYQINLETVPITGRKQFMLYLPEDDLEVGKREMDNLLAAIPKCGDEEANEVLRVISTAIAQEVNAMGLEFEWEFHLLDSPDVNAMCLPGGKVVVFVGLLKALYMALQEGEINNFADGLAFVIAHEIGHAVARHGMEKLSTIPFLGVIQVLFSTSPLLSWLESFTLDLPMSRTMETEADIIGMELMARACFNPAEAANVQMMLDDSPAFLEYFRTHPVGATRKKACDDHMPHAIKTASNHCVVCCDHNNRCRLVKQHMVAALEQQDKSAGWLPGTLNWLFGKPSTKPDIRPVDPSFWQHLGANRRPRRKQPDSTRVTKHYVQSKISQLLQGDNAITRKPRFQEQRQQQQTSSAAPGSDKDQR